MNLLSTVALFMKIYLLGFMGAGKSYWGKQLADHLNLPYYDLDEVIVEAEEMAIADIFASKGEDYFRKRKLSCSAIYLNRKVS